MTIFSDINLLQKFDAVKCDLMELASEEWLLKIIIVMNFNLVPLTCLFCSDTYIIFLHMDSLISAAFISECQWS